MLQMIHFIKTNRGKSIRFLICKARAISLPPVSQNVLPIVAYHCDIFKCQHAEFQMMQSTSERKQIASHTFVKENRRISSPSGSLQFRFMRRLMLQRQTRNLKLALVVKSCCRKGNSGLHRAGGCNASLQITNLT